MISCQPNQRSTGMACRPVPSHFQPCMMMKMMTMITTTTTNLAVETNSVLFLCTESAKQRVDLGDVEAQ